MEEPHSLQNATTSTTTIPSEAIPIPIQRHAHLIGSSLSTGNTTMHSSSSIPQDDPKVSFSPSFSRGHPNQQPSDQSFDSSLLSYTDHNNNNNHNNNHESEDDDDEDDNKTDQDFDGSISSPKTAFPTPPEVSRLGVESTIFDGTTTNQDHYIKPLSLQQHSPSYPYGGGGGGGERNHNQEDYDNDHDLIPLSETIAAAHAATVAARKPLSEITATRGSAEDHDGLGILPDNVHLGLYHFSPDQYPSVVPMRMSESTTRTRQSSMAGVGGGREGGTITGSSAAGGGGGDGVGGTTTGQNSRTSLHQGQQQQQSSSVEQQRRPRMIEKPKGIPKSIVRVDRDHDQGDEATRFESNYYPAEFRDRGISRQEFKNSIEKVNEIMQDAEESILNCVDTLLDCLTAYSAKYCCGTHYQRALKKLERFIDEENTRMYHAARIHLRDPQQVGMIYLEFEIY